MATKELVSLNVVIVGAGLAGLAAAISIALSSPHKVTVLEGASKLAEVGAGLQITPNASCLLARWGLLDKAEAVCAEPTVLVVHRYADGKLLARDAQFSKRMRSRFRAPFIDMHRVDLQQMMYARAVELGVDVKFGGRVASIDAGQGNVTIEMENGSTLQCDLIVGADGIWSKSLQSLLGAKNDPKPTGDLAYRIVLTIDQLKDDPELHDWVSNPQCHFWAGPYAHAVGYSIRRGNMFNLVLLCPDDLPADVARQSGSVDEMKALFKDWDPILTRFLDHVESVDKWKLMHRVELNTWINEHANFVLIGDACHPMLPYLAQGANSALEDGAVLGRLLENVAHKEQLGDAVRLFEQVRKRRSEAVARETFLQREQFHMPDGPEQIHRDGIFASQLDKDEIDCKLPSRWTDPDSQDWIYGYDAYAAADQVLQQSPLGRK